MTALKTLTAAAALLLVAGAAHAETMPKWQGIDYAHGAKCVHQLDGSWICSDGEQYNGAGRPLNGICNAADECHQPEIPACWAKGCRKQMH
jgi:hypothetical protein